MGRPKKIYALYKGEINIADGTVEEIAESLGVKVSTIYYYASAVYERRTSDNGYRLVRIKE